MKHWENWAAAAALIVVFLLAWFTGIWLHLQGTNLLILRIGLAALGIAVCGAFWWWFHSKRAGKAPGDEASEPGAAEHGKDEIDVLTQEADSRLRSSRVVRGASLKNLPAFLLVGNPGSAKTSLVVQSGLEPELLAGQVFREDSSVVPTRAINLWLARATVFGEAGGKLLSDPPGWAHLIRRLAPAKLGSIVGKKEQATRAVVVCFDSEEFMKPGAPEKVAATARNLQARLREVSQLLGISLPVYVVFTRLDRVKFFGEYVRNLNNEEVTRVLGVTMPLRSRTGTGVYAEQETKRLTAAFDHVFYALSDERTEFLRREHDAEKLPGTYEFPREFRKLRALVVQFLLDLCRPSQLREGPFLRGFYFTGSRTVVVSPQAPASGHSRAAAEEAFDAGIGATRVLDVDQVRADSVFERPTPAGATRVLDTGKFAAESRVHGAAVSRALETRQVQQWVFLSHLFSDALLEDRTALGTSGSSAKVSFWQRSVLAASAALLFVFSILLTVSYFGNRALESEVQDAADRISSAGTIEGQLASAESLKDLDRLRRSLETLSAYRDRHTPLHLRWGLYAGRTVYPEACRLYSECFSKLLLIRTQASLVKRFKGLPDTSGPHEDDADVSNMLEAYLVTTSNPEKSDPSFLAPALYDAWKAVQEPTAEQTVLASAQFKFYADQLKAGSCFQSRADGDAVKRAQRYLAKYGAADSIYQALLAQASQRFQSVRFADPSGVVTNNQVVAGAFTKDGWTFVQDTLTRPDQLFSGKEWVLRRQVAAVDRPKLQQDLRARYQNEFINQWRLFLRSTHLASFGTPKEASRKLKDLTDTESPLLKVFCLVSTNTSDESPEIKVAFQAPQQVVPAPCQNQYIKPPNNSYIATLNGLGLSMQTYLDAAPGATDAAANQVLSNATAALSAVSNIAQGFTLDQEANIHKTVRELMEQPIRAAQYVMRAQGPAELNAKGRAFCAQFNPLGSKYPFDPHSNVPATLAEINTFFQPGAGALAGFVNTDLKGIVTRQGRGYVGQPGGSIAPTQELLRFLDQATWVQEALYPAGATAPRLEYSLQAVPDERSESLTLNIDGKTLQYPGSGAITHFVWPVVNVRGVSLTRSGQPIGVPESYQGLWGVFSFFADGQNRQPKESGYILEWDITTQQFVGRGAVTSQAPRKKVRLYLEAGPATRILLGDLSTLKCPRKMVR